MKKQRNVTQNNNSTVTNTNNIKVNKISDEEFQKNDYENDQ
jgi:hypothetical protein